MLETAPQARAVPALAEAALEWERQAVDQEAASPLRTHRRLEVPESHTPCHVRYRQELARLEAQAVETVATALTFQRPTSWAVHQVAGAAQVQRLDLAGTAENGARAAVAAELWSTA